MHPAIKILGLICLGVALNKLGLGQLLCMLSLMAFAIAYLKASLWLRMLWRMRWLFLSMLLVYGLTTPGEYIQWMPVDWGVTYEGARAGSLQIVRLVTMLGGIALLVATSDRNSLIAGFYCLLMPLKVFELRPERFAARLCLTLQYLEDADFMHQKRKAKNFWAQLLDLNLNQRTPHQVQVIELTLPKLAYVDFIGVLLMLTALIIIWF